MAHAEAFDLNIEEVLEHWTVAHALRELIANALDEQVLSNTEDPQIAPDSSGGWHVRDFGRGLRPEHLTQRENPEKLKHPHLIGKFGVGLKDALAVLHRHRVDVVMRSRWADISIGMRPKHGFEGITTLHALVSPSSDPLMVGTEVVVTGVTASDIDVAKDFFLTFSGDPVLEVTKVGAVLEVVKKRSPRIYVNGLHVADEPGFLFSYNITSLTQGLRKALNRERTNVGRTAYGERVRAILTQATEPTVVSPLAEDLSRFAAGGSHEEVKTWRDAAVHACKALSAIEKVVFVTSSDALGPQRIMIDYARDDGLRVIVVPDDVCARLNTQSDLAGNPLRNLAAYAVEWNQSFEYTFVEPDALTIDERRVFEQTAEILKLADMGKSRRLVREVRVSETMRPGPLVVDVDGVWEPDHGRIVIHRRALKEMRRYAGTLLHETAHVMTGAQDVSLLFESGLSDVTGKVATVALTHPVKGGAT